LLGSYDGEDHDQGRSTLIWLKKKLGSLSLSRCAHHGYVPIEEVLCLLDEQNFRTWIVYGHTSDDHAVVSSFERVERDLRSRRCAAQIEMMLKFGAGFSISPSTRTRQLAHAVCNPPGAI
jgi:hypothetical protein